MPLVVEGIPFYANFLCSLLRELDVVLSMVWLSRHHILIDHFIREVFLEVGVFVFLGEHQLGTVMRTWSPPTVLLTSSMKGGKRICAGLSWCISERRVWLLSVREFEFTIDLEPRTGAILMAPTGCQNWKVGLRVFLRRTYQTERTSEKNYRDRW